MQLCSDRGDPVPQGVVIWVAGTIPETFPLFFPPHPWSVGFPPGVLCLA